MSGEGLFVDETKNRSSVRMIQLSAGMVQLLHTYRAWQSENRLALGDQWKDTDRVFTNADGSPIQPNSLTHWFTNFVRRKGLPHVTLHGLRHTSASLLISVARTDIRTVSARLGHSQTSTTLNTYSHVIESADRAAAESLGDILAPTKKRA